MIRRHNCFLDWKLIGGAHHSMALHAEWRNACIHRRTSLVCRAVASGPGAAGGAGCDDVLRPGSMLKILHGRGMLNQRQTASFSYAAHGPAVYSQSMQCDGASALHCVGLCVRAMCAGVQVRRFGVRGDTDAISAGLAAHLRVQAFRFKFCPRATWRAARRRRRPL